MVSMFRGKLAKPPGGFKHPFLTVALLIHVVVGQTRGIRLTIPGVFSGEHPTAQPEGIEGRNAPFPLISYLVIYGTIIWVIAYIVLIGVLKVKI